MYGSVRVCMCVYASVLGVSHGQTIPPIESRADSPHGRGKRVMDGKIETANKLQQRRTRAASFPLHSVLLL